MWEPGGEGRPPWTTLSRNPLGHSGPPRECGFRPRPAGTLGEGGEDGGDGRVIAGESVSQRVAHAIARSEHEEAALLYGIASPHPLSEARRERAQAFHIERG